MVVSPGDTVVGGDGFSSELLDGPCGLFLPPPRRRHPLGTAVVPEPVVLDALREVDIVAVACGAGHGLDPPSRTRSRPHPRTYVVRVATSISLIHGPSHLCCSFLFFSIRSALLVNEGTPCLKTVPTLSISSKKTTPADMRTMMKK